jgi:two-component system, NarL family, invasion response regulator UvrY
VIKVLLVDDHKIVRTGIRGIFEATDDIEVMGEAASGEEAVKFVRTHVPDVALMDLQMPGMGGLEATKSVTRISPRTRVLVLTSYEDEIFPMRLLRNGAAGYLTKGCASDELLEAVRQMSTGERYLSPDIAKQLALRRFDDKVNSPFEILSERELQVMLMTTRGEKVTQIAEELHLSPKTINTYRYRVFQKLGVNNDVELTHLALRYGIIDNPMKDDE